MFRIAAALSAVALLFAPVAADEPKPAKPTVELSGSIDDESLQQAMPAGGVIVSQKGYEKLAKAWGIQDAPKVHFAKEILVVATWKGSSFDIRTDVKNGDLTIGGFGTKDLRPGFRWKVKSITREGIKTVGGKELPKE